jgi:hypothetical protein
MRSHRVRTAAVMSLVVLAVAGGYFVGRARAGGIPASNALTYGGTLTDAAGAPLTGSKNIQVVFWDMATGGAQQCSTTSTAIPLVAGAFQVALPDTCVAAIRAKPDLWTEVFVDGGGIGRVKIGAVPYAIEANHAVTADSAPAAAVASAISTSAVTIETASCTFKDSAYTDCTCPNGGIAIAGGACSGGCSAGIALAESMPISATTWRVSCGDASGNRVQCASPRVSCLKAQ